MAALTRTDLSRFFAALDRRLPCRVTLVLTGGCEALLLGCRRPTRDVDFALVPARGCERFWPEIEAAVGGAAREVGVSFQYSADIDRWSSVTIPRAHRKSRPYRCLRRLRVRLLDPACWAVYKLARYLDSDVEDLRVVLRKERVPSRSLARLCGVSLRSSPRSTQLFLFRKQLEHFFRKHGRIVWGTGFDPEQAIVAFHRAAGIRTCRRGS